MNIQNLKYFLALADREHFGKASQACFVTQPTLSIQIKNLEKELGVELFERNHKRVLLTSAGKKLVKHAQEILHGIKQMQTVAEQEKDLFAAEISLGIIPTVCPYILPAFLSNILKKYPRLKLSFVEDKTEALLQKLEEGTLDAIMIASSVETKGMQVASIGKEEFFLAISSSHPLSKKEKISYEEIQGESLLLLEEGHCLRDQIIDYCQQIKLKDSADVSATNLETLLGMIASGFKGLTLVPKLAKKPREGIVFLPFQTCPPERNIQMLWRKSSVKQEILQMMCTEFQGLFLFSL